MISYIDRADLSEKLSVAKQGNNKVLLRVSSSILFDSAQATITPSAQLLLEEISIVLSEYKDFIKMIWIEGHTDDRPINSKIFPSNWELSASRAINVAKCLLDTSNLAPEQLSAVGYSEFQPIANNDTEENRTKNRRVDFIIETLDE